MEETKIAIPHELFAPAESLSYSGTYALPVLKAGPDLYSFETPLSWRVDITNTGDALLVTGEVEGVGRTACARCLDPLDVDVLGDIEGYFLIDEQGTPEDDEMEEDEFSVLSADNIIDLVPLMQAAILVDLPLVPLCSEDCRGICPDCGVNLNHETCDCASKRQAEEEREAQAANPFSVLKDLHLDDNSDSSRS